MFKLDFPRRQYNIISNNYFKTFTNYFGMNMKTYNKMLNWLILRKRDSVLIFTICCKNDELTFLVSQWI